MRAWLCVCVAALLLATGVARAVSADTTDADAVVRDKVERDERGPGMAEALRREEARRAEAEKRAEAIRNLPPARVQDWIDGKISESELERLATGPRAPAQEGAVAVSRGRLNRLFVVSVAVLVLALLYGAQRRKARMGSMKENKTRL